MNNNQQSQDKNTSTSDRWNAGQSLRVEKAHGGVNVEEIEKPELMNEPDCKHEKWEIDPTETEFIAYICANPKCGIVKLFDKGE